MKTDHPNYSTPHLNLATLWEYFNKNSVRELALLAYQKFNETNICLDPYICLDLLIESIYILSVYTKLVRIVSTVLTEHVRSINTGA